MKHNKLNSNEKKVILDKGTEPAFSGEFNNYKKTGIYTCKRCNSLLYKSDDKFNSGCGWPSFDDEIKGAIKRSVDADGIRTEITCANCGAHLGHVFTDEHYTEKNIRHCVNSISMNFIPEKQTETAIFAGGCFWGTEYHFKKVKGVISTQVGYIGGKPKNPTYIEVSTSNTGHAESVKITFIPSIVTYEQLTKLFFEIHDFTQINRQGSNIGEQYRSGIFYTTDKQKNIAKKLINLLKQKNYKVATKITKAGKFWEAENYHQNYYGKHDGLPTCHSYRKIF